jgi:menaquinone-dependent protoporphyrinogen IX oxidase
VLRVFGHDVGLHDVTDRGDTIPAGYDGVIVGASIYTRYGFIERHMAKKIVTSPATSAPTSHATTSTPSGTGSSASPRTQQISTELGAPA